jgi:DNA-binding NarL/FixJ family response regulator
MKIQVNIGIAEDHRLVRKGFIRMLSDYRNIHVIFEAANGQELLDGLAANSEVDMVLLDIRMPVLDGIEAIKRIRQSFPRVKIIMISQYSDTTHTLECAKLGANAVIDKDCDPEKLVKVIINVKKHGGYFDEPIVKLLMQQGISPAGKDSEMELTQRNWLSLNSCAVARA